MYEAVRAVVMDEIIKQQINNKQTNQQINIHKEG